MSALCDSTYIVRRELSHPVSSSYIERHLIPAASAARSASLSRDPGSRPSVGSAFHAPSGQYSRSILRVSISDATDPRPGHCLAVERLALHDSSALPPKETVPLIESPATVPEYIKVRSFPP